MSKVSSSENRIGMVRSIFPSATCLPSKNKTTCRAFSATACVVPKTKAQDVIARRHRLLRNDPIRVLRLIGIRVCKLRLTLIQQQHPAAKAASDSYQDSTRAALGIVISAAITQDLFLKSGAAPSGMRTIPVVVPITTSPHRETTITSVEELETFFRGI
jgi:hypothetical protein